MNLQVDIYDEADNVKWTVTGNCCQLGLWCKFPCEACQKVDFEVRNKAGEVVGSLGKRTAGCAASMVSDTANFETFFPSGATEAEKALLLAAIIMLDFHYFEEKPQGTGV